MKEIGSGDLRRLPSFVSLAVLGFLYLVVGLRLIGVSDELAELLAFCLAIAVLPAAAAGAALLGRGEPERPSPAEAVDFLLATAALLLLALTPLTIQRPAADVAGWHRLAFAVTAAAVGVHLLLRVLLAALPRWRETVARSAALGVLGRAGVRSVVLAYALGLAFVTTFRIEPGNARLNLVFDLLLSPDWLGTGPFLLGLLASAAVLALALYLLVGERNGLARGPGWRRAALAAAILLLPLAFFDFSLTSDVFHYLTNLAPALHIRHGGVPMVDTFSQYGPGPVYAVLAGLAVGRPSIGLANIVAQIANLLLYAAFLACLYRLSRYRLAALVLGLVAIAVTLAGWAGGDHVISNAPSTMGLRYLQPMLMVLAVTFLRPGATQSVATSLVLIFAAMWSIETLIGTLGVLLGAAVFVRLRQRAFGALLLDGAIMAALVAAGLALTAAIALLRSGDWPRFDLYLAFLEPYSMVSESWSIPGRGLFWGWAAMLLAVVVVLGDAWLRALRPDRRVLPAGDDPLFHGFVPMAILTAFMATYYVARSVEFTLITAFLPFAGLAIPAVLALFDRAMVGSRAARATLPLAIFAVLWVSTFGLVALLRPQSPYSLLVHQCRDAGRCTPAAVLTALDERLRLRPGLDPGEEFFMQRWLDQDGLMNDTLRLVEGWAADQEKVELLLGHLYTRSYPADLVHLYSGKWFRWPRSMTFSDELIPALREEVIAARVTLADGELIFVRRDETQLGPLEAGILARIRAEYQLCELDTGAPAVTAYRVTRSGDCGI